MSTMLQPAPRGWIFAGMVSEVEDVEIAPVDAAGVALMLVREQDQINVYDAACPHRGSHLAFGGKLSKGCVTCPFHGRRIRLVEGEGSDIAVAKRTSVRLGDAIYVLAGDDADDRGFASDVAPYRDWVFRQAVDMLVKVAGHWVVENAFDPEHFREVHHVPDLDDPVLETLEGGALQVTSAFKTVLDPFASVEIREAIQRMVGSDVHVKRRAGYASPFRAVAHSPHLVATHLVDDDSPSVVITSGLRPLEARGGDLVSRIRVVIGAPADTPEHVRGRMEDGARKAIAEDTAVWEHIVAGHEDQLDERDAPAIALSRFFAGFEGFESFELSKRG